MRLVSNLLWIPIAVLVGACDLWPRNLEPLAEAITRQADGRATAWLMGGDVVVIDVANYPLYRSDPEQLATDATGIAGRAIEYATVPLESISVTFHAGEVGAHPATTREFIFLVRENRPVLQPPLDAEAAGPLTVAEVRALIIDRMDAPSSDGEMECVLREAEDRVRAAGDPETLDPSTVELLPTGNWDRLDAFGRRLVLAQVIATKASFVCKAPLG